MSCDGLLGKDAYLAVQPVGDNADLQDVTWHNQTLAAGGWLEVFSQDVDFDRSKEKIDVSDRASPDFKRYVPGLAEGNLTFKAIKRASDPWFAQVRTAYNTDTPITVLMLDGQADGAEGIIANCNIFNFSESQPINGAIEVSFELAVSGCSAASPPIATAALDSNPNLVVTTI